MQFISSQVRTPLALAGLATLVSLLFFQLAPIRTADSNTFTALFEKSVSVKPVAFDGIASLLLAKLVQFVGEPALAMRLVTAILGGVAAYLLTRLLQSVWGATAIVCGICFLFFAMSSPSGVLTIAWSAGVLLALNYGKLPMAAVLVGLGFGADQFLSIVFSLYIVWYSATKHGPKEAVRSAGLVIFGIGVWVLLAWMLFGSSGIGQAIGSGFGDLVTQLNPLNFGVAVILTFNILLIRFLRIKAQRSHLPYLGSWLIAVFLFVRSEPHYIVILHIVGMMYLREIDPEFMRHWMIPAYAVINLVLFFLLPDVSPIAARYQPRVDQESEATTYFNQYLSQHMPSYTALGEKETKLKAGRELLGKTDSGGAVVLDPMTAAWFSQQALGAGVKNRFIGRYEGEPGRFTSQGRDTSLMSPVREAASRYYLANKNAPEPVVGALTKISESSGLTLYAIDSTNLKGFFDAYIYTYFTSHH